MIELFTFKDSCVEWRGEILLLLYKHENPFHRPEICLGDGSWIQKGDGRKWNFLPTNLSTTETSAHFESLPSQAGLRLFSQVVEEDFTALPACTPACRLLRTKPSHLGHWVSGIAGAEKSSWTIWNDNNIDPEEDFSFLLLDLKNQQLFFENCKVRLFHCLYALFYIIEIIHRYN